MDPQLSGYAPRGTRQAQQKGREHPMHDRALAAIQERAREVIEGALATLRFTPVALQTGLGCDRLPSATSCRERQLPLLKSFNWFDKLAIRVQTLGFLLNAIPHEVVPIP